MDNLQITRVSKALGLENKILGLRFLVLEKEYNDSLAEEHEGLSLCSLVKLACRGKSVKCNASTIGCDDAAYAMGLKEVPEYVYSGRKEYEDRKYLSKSIAFQVQNEKKYIPQKIYGAIISPLEEIENPDLVIVIATAKDMMRLTQGYSRYYGVNKNLLSIGVQGICSELVSKPFMNNDLNVSLLSNCCRKLTDFSAGCMGASFPIHLVENIFRGILETVNLTENNIPKKKILERLDSPDELGFEIVMNYDYAIQASKYEEYCEECIKACSNDKEGSNE
ncbi:DUF169 domain-containing protein [Peptacetobacter hiranonis]|uniref:DUF169 domain-containing protein n=1 Tax=Peptacetobacter hiranonis (strain DSM 13275 / JCM 10541 / KCTC 15199 / TO-931) TaxID=500633 RepID=B6G2A3_PEPHT|nr:DUF169 domain-containing protein [Peptacetobacter hiranonis]EEA84095.1 hypothetical protein CLOHIR_02265 [Peptacetobacter hiranonis DSM 13275]QEK21729.1 hypothetical protein KGNDJEFE_02227 [Peptacetobacter hiranonis]